MENPYYKLASCGSKPHSKNPIENGAQVIATGVNSQNHKGVKVHTGGTGSGSSANISLVIDASAAAVGAYQVLLGDFFKINELALAGALGAGVTGATTAGYAAASVNVSGTYGPQTLEVLKCMSVRGFVMTNLHVEAYAAGVQDATYFSKNLKTLSALAQGNSNSSDYVYPKTAIIQEQPGIRQACDFSNVVGPLDGVLIPVAGGQKVVFTFDMPLLSADIADMNSTSKSC